VRIQDHWHPQRYSRLDAAKIPDCPALPWHHFAGPDSQEHAGEPGPHSVRRSPLGASHEIGSGHQGDYQSSSCYPEPRASHLGTPLQVNSGMSRMRLPQNHIPVASVACCRSESDSPRRYPSLSASQSVIPEEGRRIWVMVSRSRMVTVSSCKVCESMVTHQGVPISSWRR